METRLAFACCLLAGIAAAEHPHDCTITAVHERVLPEQSAGPQRPIEEGEIAPPPSNAAVFQVVIACGQKKHFAVFTSAGNFNRSAFDAGRAVRVSIEDGVIRIEGREGTHATGRLAVDR